MKRLLKIGLPLALVAALVVSYYATRTTAAAEVMTATVTRGDVVASVSATGALDAVTTVQVGTQVSGTIAGLHADFNSTVRKGAVLARLEPSLFEAQVEQARASVVRAEADADRLRVTLEEARSQAGRAQALGDRGLIAATEREAAAVAVRSAEAQLRSAQAQVTQARAALNQAEINLRHTIIRSHIDGVVVSRNVDVGQTVAASMQAPTLFVLAADLTRMQVTASIDEADVGRVAEGQPARFRVDAHPEDEFTGKVAQVRLQPVVEQNVVTYRALIDVANDDLRLKPGMTATVAIETAREADTLRVPNAALRFRPTAETYAALGLAPPDRADDMPRTRDQGAPPAAAANAAQRARPEGSDGSRFGVVWRLSDGRLDPIRVALGASDGTQTAVAGRALEPGMPLLTGVATPTVARQASGPNPLMPQRRGASRGGER
jgi:HlyD family secretion protein